jgi:hypothetical protein
MVDSIQAGPGTRRPYLRVTGRMAETAGDYWICPTTGTYNLHAEICNGASFGFGYMITVNRKPLASVTIPYIISNTVADYSVQTMDANSVALTAGDMVGLGALMSDYNSGWLNRVDGAEGTASTCLRWTSHTPTVAMAMARTARRLRSGSRCKVRLVHQVTRTSACTAPSRAV